MLLSKYFYLLLLLGSFCFSFSAQARGSLKITADVSVSQKELIEGEPLTITVSNISESLPEGSSIFIQVFPFIWDRELISTGGYHISSENEPYLSSSGGYVTLYPTVSDRTVDESTYLTYSVSVALIVTERKTTKWYFQPPQYFTVYKK